MRRRREVRTGGARLLALVVSLVAIVPTVALEGTVVDSQGDPIRGANVCYIAGGAALVCAETLASGWFKMMDSGLDEVRISADGYMRRVIRPSEAAEPIKLQRAPIVLVRLTDASTGEPLEHGEIYVVYPKGSHVGPFPAHRNGVRIRRIEVDGEIKIRTRAKGYISPEPRPLRVGPGGEYEVEIELTPKAEPK